MKVIYKYPVAAPSITNHIPRGAIPLHVAQQGDGIYVWMEVDTMQPLQEREFGLFGTGQPLPPDHARYLGTALTHGGSLVLHAYDITKVVPALMPTPAMMLPV